MSEAEIIELSLMYREAIGVDAMNVTAVFMAFLVTVYIIGDKIQKSWAIALCIVYTLFMLAPIGSALGLVTERQILAAKYVELYPDGVLAAEYLEFSNTPATYFFVVAPLLLGWILSLIYLIFRMRGSA